MWTKSTSRGKRNAPAFVQAGFQRCVLLDQIATVLTVRVSISWRTWAYRRGLRAERICRAARTALAGSRTVMTGTLLGARKDDQTSSGNSLTVAGTVMTGMVDIAESVGPAPFDRPI